MGLIFCYSPLLYILYIVYFYILFIDDLINACDTYNNAFSSRISDIYVGDDGKLHKTTGGGADSVLNFSKGGTELIYVGTTSSTINVTSKISNYQSKTVNDFIVEMNNCTTNFYGNLGDMKIWVRNETDVSASGGATFSKSYNSSTGILTVSPNSVIARNSKSYGITYFAYKVYCK